MSSAGIVYLSLGRLLLDRPGTLVYHAIDRTRSEWPRYWPDLDGVNRAHGDEAHYTSCGRLIYRYHHIQGQRNPALTRKLDGIRLDNAQLIGRPCRRCYP